jgi:hypothetical protein
MSASEVIISFIATILITLWVVFAIHEDKIVQQGVKEFLERGLSRRELARRKKERKRKTLFKGTRLQ